MTPHRFLRLLLLVIAAISFLSAMWVGLIRLGWPWETWLEDAPKLHGPLMVSSFLGTLIGLERAVALGSRWGYAGPFFSGLGGLVLILNAGSSIAGVLIVAAGMILVGMFALMIHRQPSLFMGVMGAGAAAWLIGSLLWLSGWKGEEVVLWWVGFLLLTIAGERLEMSRILRITRKSRLAFLAGAGIFLGGAGLSLVRTGEGIRWAGLGMILLAVWLVVNDVARRTVRQEGLPRYIALCLLIGNLWLTVSGALAFRYGPTMPGLSFDAILHAFFLGFVFSMIFGHAPVIFPAVLGVPIPFRRSFYIPLAFLHASLLLRIGADLTDWWEGRLWAGLLNVAALILFFGNTARVGWSARASRMPPKASSAP